jgi:hypothetical protein|tara:strand:- start:587 stop:1030 length:444 start_codon:yes stop_codon:yes gene_type:complete
MTKPNPQYFKEPKLKLNFTKGIIILICSMILIRCGDNSPSKDINPEPTELELKNIAIKEHSERQKKRVIKQKKIMEQKARLNAERRDDRNRARKQRVKANNMKMEKARKNRVMQMEKARKNRDKQRQERLKRRLMKKNELLKMKTNL